MLQRYLKITTLPNSGLPVADVWGTLLLVDTAAVKSSFVIANVLITEPGPYTVVDMGDTNNGSPYQTWTNSKAATRQRCCAE